MLSESEVSNITVNSMESFAYRKKTTIKISSSYIFSSTNFRFVLTRYCQNKVSCRCRTGMYRHAEYRSRNPKEETERN